MDYSINGKGTYIMAHSQAYSTADFERDLKEPYAWPGGYPRYFITKDGGALSFAAAEERKAEILEAIEGAYGNDQWWVCACEINWEDTNLYCDHTCKRIESAYGEDDETEEG